MRTLALVAIALIISALPAHAQFGGSVVYDPTVDSDVRLDAQINRFSAWSLITGGGGGNFQSTASYLQSLNQDITRGIGDPQKFAANFPGWLALGPNAARLPSKYQAPQ